MKKYQQIHLNLDDSGKLVPADKVSIYSGLVFFSDEEKDSFAREYEALVDELKCSYCRSNIKWCVKRCPELKSCKLKPNDRRRLVNIVKKYKVIACVIRNDAVYDNIKKDVASRRRFIDYALKRTIKQMFENLILNNDIDPYKPVKLILNMDQESTKSNGYYSLDEGIKEEFLYGVNNFDYEKKKDPILFSDFKIVLKYLDSKYDTLIQGADIISGEIRRKYIYASTKSVAQSRVQRLSTYQTFLP